tara:strand:+ start:1751 stop:1996 length:246 start_codon:yes stop_codon:yes gene_type:complete
MADGRVNNGGHKTNGGRKSKSEEIQMIERLTPLEPKAFKALEEGIENGDFKYVQMFYNYYAGKPKETKDISITSEQPLFDL